MRLVSFEAEGRRSFGVVSDGFVTDLAGVDPQIGDLRGLLAAGLDGARIAAGHGEILSLETITLLPVIPNGDSKMFCLGWAYADHRAETDAGAPGMPFFFLKHPHALVGHGQDLVKPRVSDCFDFEGELAVVIGRAGRDIAEADALAHVAGYTLMMDGSVRDWQNDSVTAGKNFERSSALGPWLVTADEVADPHALHLTTRLNGTLMQDTTTDLLLWSVSYLIRYCSQIATLQPGDVIATGTPAGVGHKRNPQVFMRPGDVIEVEVEGLGTLRNRIVAEAP